MKRLQVLSLLGLVFIFSTGLDGCMGCNDGPMYYSVRITAFETMVSNSSSDPIEPLNGQKIQFYLLPMYDYISQTMPSPQGSLISGAYACSPAEIMTYEENIESVELWIFENDAPARVVTERFLSATSGDGLYESIDKAILRSGFNNVLQLYYQDASTADSLAIAFKILMSQGTVIEDTTRFYQIQ